MRSLIKHAVLLWLAFAALQAGAQTGSIKGLIIDEATQEALIGVNITTEDALTGGTSDIDGKYEIANLKAGTYKLQFSYIGYAIKMVDNIVVKENEVTTVNVSLGVARNELEAIEVVDFKKTNTETAVLLEVKQANQIANGVSYQQISRSSDKDAGQVVKRIPGITMLGNFINIRGLNQRYNTVLLNNAVAPSIEADNKAFSFDIVPSSQLDRILVYKSPSSDVVGDFAGGIVKIYTRSLPDSNFWSFNYGTSVRTGTTFKPFYQQQNDGLFYLGFDKYHQLPKNFPSDIRSVQSIEELQTASQSVNNNWDVNKSASIPDQRFTITKGTRIRADKCLVGNITSLNFSITKQAAQVFRADYDAFNQEKNTSSPKYQYNDQTYVNNTRWGLIHNWSFKFDGKHFIEFDNLVNINSTSQFTDRTGNNLAQTRVAHDRSYYQLYRGIISSQISGKHELSEGLNSFNWVAGYNYSYRNEPDFKRYITSVDTLTGTENIYVPQQVSPDFLGKFYSKLKEHMAQGQFNYTHKFLKEDSNKFLPTISVGTYIEYKNRDFNARNIGYMKGSIYAHPVTDQGIDAMFASDQIGTDGVLLGEATKASDSYTSNNLLSAVYANTELSVRNIFKLVAGVRYEYILQQLHSADEKGPVTVKDPMSSVLPSINMSVNINEKMLFRVAYGMTNNRPEFREIAPFSFYDFNNGYVFVGNPNLSYCTIHNADVKWEYYPSKGESISAGFFYKHFINPIEVISVLGADRTFSFQNAAKADAYGAEIELKKNFSRTANNFLKDFGINLNAAYIYSRVKLSSKDAVGQSNNRPLQGQAPYTINAGIFYNNRDLGLQWNIMYNITGRRIVFVGSSDYPDVYQMPRNALDFNISYSFRKGVELSFNASDVINQKYLLLQDGNADGKWKLNSDQVIQSYRPGGLYTFGIKYTVK